MYVQNIINASDKSPFIPNIDKYWSSEHTRTLYIYINIQVHTLISASYFVPSSSLTLANTILPELSGNIAAENYLSCSFARSQM